MAHEFTTTKPAIFDRADLDWLQYVETRRADKTNMTGNMSDDPRVLNRDTYDLLQPDIPFEVWLDQEQTAVNERIAAIKSLYNFSKIGRPRPEHGVTVIQLDKDIDSVSDENDATNRIFADATLLTTPGYASMIPPADCIVATVAYPSKKAVGQIHVGFRGAARNIVASSLEQFKDKGLDPSEAVVYFSPHVQSGFPLNEAETAELYQILDSMPIEQRRTVEKYLRGTTSHPVMDLTGLALDEFRQSHVPDDNIQTSAQDTFSDPTLFSDFKKNGHRYTGRFGVIAGIKEIS